MAQPPSSRKSFAIVQALFRKFILRTALVAGIAFLTLPLAAVHAASAAQIERDVRIAARQLYANNPEARALARQAEAVLIFPSIVKAGLFSAAAWQTGASRERTYLRLLCHGGSLLWFPSWGGAVWLCVLFYRPCVLELFEAEPRVGCRSRAISDNPEQWLHQILLHN